MSQQQRQFIQPGFDIFQSRGLKLSGAADAFTVERQGALGRLALGTKLIEEAAPFEILNRAYFGRIRLLVQIPPLRELLERLLEGRSTA